MTAVAAFSSTNSTVNLSSIIRAQYAQGRIALPVQGGLYTRLKHIQGVPTRSADGGYSVSKLRMIDLLVDRLIKLKGTSPEGLAESARAAGLSTGEGRDMDALIAHYASDVAERLRAAAGLSTSVTSGLVEPGMLFSLVA